MTRSGARGICTELIIRVALQGMCSGRIRHMKGSAGFVSLLISARVLKYLTVARSERRMA